ncbi:MAG: hypothetical protein NTX71_09350 [Candidatus Aureabacteria bacterium]|nr:hypothetical protein [Candidatus Auribacterota bacterium]
MKSICENIITGHEDRKSGIRELKKQAAAVQDNARKFLADSRKFHQEMAKEQKAYLQRKRDELIKNVNALRKDFKKKEQEIKADLAEASRTWNKMNETLRSKKSNSLPAPGLRRAGRQTEKG